MKHLKIAGLLLLLVLFLSECKKAEGETKMSLRTRKNRLTGEWRLTKGNASYTTTDGYNESITFDGSNLTRNVTSYYPIVYTGKYSLNLNIMKDGTFSFKETRTGETLEASGTWNFNTGVGGAKRKEKVVFFIDNVKTGYTNTGFNLFNRFAANFAYEITMLNNKEISIHSAGKIYTDEKNRYVTLSTDYTLQQ